MTETEEKRSQTEKDTLAIKGETENILTGSTQVQNYYSAQATTVLIKQSKGKDATQDREVGHGD